MKSFARLTLVLGLAGLLQACQLAAPGGPDSSAPTTNAVAGDPIEVTALDAPAATSPTGQDTAQPPAAASVAAAADPVADPTAAPIAEGEGTTDAAQIATEQTAETQTAENPTAAGDGEAAPDPEAEVIAEPKSEKQLACERKRGRWVRAVGSLMACVFPTSDGGKQCTRESQCEGVCLARSGTCSPATPLFGCNEILQDDGARVTLCID